MLERVSESDFFDQDVSYRDIPAKRGAQHPDELGDEENGKPDTHRGGKVVGEAEQVSPVSSQ